jgi:hypothetical protein
MPGEAVQPLACPTCARRFELSESFCPTCAMPLVYVGRGDEAPITATHERAGKIDPRYTGGELVKAAFARNQAEAELIQGILREEGIPSVERRARGFDVPDFLAAGPRDILVPRPAYEPARELLAGGGNGELEPQSAQQRPLRLLVGLLIALAVAALAVWCLYLLVL